MRSITFERHSVSHCILEVSDDRDGLKNIVLFRLTNDEVKKLAEDMLDAGVFVLEMKDK